MIRGAYQRLCDRPDGENLGLDFIGGNLTWEFMSGMKIDHIQAAVDYLLSFKEIPDYVIFHCVGNDIGSKASAVIIAELKQIFEHLKIILPGSKFIWSQILPRRTWRYIECTHFADRARKRINSSISTFVIKNGGHYIKYPDIKGDFKFICHDDTHLSAVGYDIMLNNISAALYAFHTCGHPVFPMS